MSFLQMHKQRKYLFVPIFPILSAGLKKPIEALKKNVPETYAYVLQMVKCTGCHL